MHNWSYCNKSTDCEVLVCKLFLFIYCIYAQHFKQLLSLPSYPFGSINHFCHQSQKPWINMSKKAMPRSWRLTLLPNLCTLVIKIWSQYSMSRWLTLMVGTLSSHGLLTYEQFMAGWNTQHNIQVISIGCITFTLRSYLFVHRSFISYMPSFASVSNCFFFLMSQHGCCQLYVWGWIYI